MSLRQAIDLAIEVETLISVCYQKTSELCPEVDLASVLTRMSREEIQHAHLLRAGKTYLNQAPEAFSQERVKVAEIEAGLMGTAELLSEIESQKLSFFQIIERLRQLESELEKVHLNSIAVINDENLKRLFKALAGEDQKHVDSLSELLERLK